jgi:hypothetical protein
MLLMGTGFREENIAQKMKTKSLPEILSRKESPSWHAKGLHYALKLLQLSI